MSRVLSFTVEELESEVKDLMHKCGVYMGPSMVRKIVQDMEVSVRDDRLEKERKARKDSDFTYLSEMNTQAIIRAYMLTPDQMARAQGFYPSTHLLPTGELKPQSDCPMCDAGVPVSQVRKTGGGIKALVKAVNEKFQPPGGEWIQHQAQKTVRVLGEAEVKEALSGPLLPMSVVRSAAEQDDLVGAIVHARTAQLAPDPLKEKVAQAFGFGLTPGDLTPGDTSIVYAKTGRGRLPDIDEDKKADACECGAFTTSGAPKGNHTHSSWCPWSRNV